MHRRSGPPPCPSPASRGLSRDALISCLTHPPAPGSSDGLCAFAPTLPAHQRGGGAGAAEGLRVWCRGCRWQAEGAPRSGLRRAERLPGPAAFLRLLC